MPSFNIDIDYSEIFEEISDNKLLEEIEKRKINYLKSAKAIDGLPNHYMMEALNELLQKETPQRIEQILREHL